MTMGTACDISGFRKRGGDYPEWIHHQRILHVPYSLSAPYLNPMVKVSHDHSITENNWLKMPLKINIPETAGLLTEGYC